jgi:hypothetical protein
VGGERQNPEWRRKRERTKYKRISVFVSKSMWRNGIGSGRAVCIKSRQCRNGGLRKKKGERNRQRKNKAGERRGGGRFIKETLGGKGQRKRRK